MRNTCFLERLRIKKVLFTVYDYPLIILEAPMGYGKTAAVQQFIETENIKHFWFTFLDLNHSESVFWNKFTDVIREMDLQAGSALKSLGLPVNAPQMEKVLRILSDKFSERNFLMVLDDYHLARDKGLKMLIMQLAREEIEGLHILLITRDTSDIDFVELLAKGICCIITRHHLKFTKSEVRDYCRMMMEAITDEDLSKIWEYTDGWISFIYIILLGLENGIPVGMSTNVEEMVEKALFAPYGKEMQDYLLKLSVMEDFTADQAKFVTDNKSAAMLLKKLHKENAFVFYDEKNRTYKIHNILLDFLRLKQNFSEDEACKLYSRLGDWYVEKQEFQTAYGYWNKAGLAKHILAHLNNPQNIQNTLNTFTGADELFNNTPRDILFQYPLAYLLHIFHSIIRGKQNLDLGWTQRLNELQRYYEQLDNIDETYRNRILAETLIVRKLTYFNHFAEIIASDQEIIRLLNGKNSYLILQGYTYTLGSPQYLFIYYRETGTLKKLAEMLSKYVEFTQFSNGCGTGSDSLAQAEYALETGDFANVERSCLQAMAKAETMSQIYIIMSAKFSLIRLYIAQGRLPEALELLGQLEQDAERINRPFYNTAVDLCRGYIYASICQPEQIPPWLQIGDMTSANSYDLAAAYNYLVYGKGVMAAKKYGKLEAVTGQLNKILSVYNNHLGLIHTKIFKAAANYSLYGTSQGAMILREALNEARADNLVMPFIESSPHILGMLQLIVQDNPGDAFGTRILTLCRKYAKTIQGICYHPTPLSQREIDILSLAAEGLSRKEMAMRLYISDETVKTHFKNIYQKLGVNSKISAIKIAQGRGYLQNVSSIS